MPDAHSPLPFEAYDGKEPYIFVSYCHRDGRAVFPDIKHLHNEGYRIWYDEGIDPGNEWPDEIARALDGAAHFLVFITENSCASKNVRNEINFALAKDKRLLAVHLSETVLPRALELQIGGIQAILKHRMLPERYYRRLASSLPDTLRGTPPRRSEPEGAPDPARPSGDRATPKTGPSFWNWKRLSDFFASPGPVSTGRPPFEKSTVRPPQAPTPAARPTPPPAFIPPMHDSSGRVEQPSHAEVVSVPLLIQPSNRVLQDLMVTHASHSAVVPMLVLSGGGREDMWASGQPWFGKSRIRLTASVARGEGRRDTRFCRASIRVRSMEYRADGQIRPWFGTARLARTRRGGPATGGEGARFGAAVIRVTDVVNSRTPGGAPRFGRVTIRSRR